MADRKTGARYIRSGFANGKTIAGYGILEDDYSEESGNRDYEKKGWNRPKVQSKPEELKKPMDNLARNAMLARQAGMSYGKWKATQEPVNIEKKEIPEGWNVCQHCGKVYKPRAGQRQKYCDITCSQQAQRKKRRER